MFKWPRHEKVREHAGGGRSNLMLCRRDGYTKRGALSLGGARSLSVPPLGAAICRNPYLHTVVHEPVLMEFGGAWMIRCPGAPRLPAADGLAPLAAHAWLPRSPGRLLAPENKQFQSLSLALNFPFLGHANSRSPLMPLLVPLLVCLSAA